MYIYIYIYIYTLSYRSAPRAPRSYRSGYYLKQVFEKLKHACVIFTLNQSTVNMTTRICNLSVISLCFTSISITSFTALYFCGAIELIFYIVNRTIYMHAWILEIWNLFLVLNRISLSFALLTREISWSTLKINFMLL